MRFLREDDLDAVCRIYNHYVLGSVISFEEDAVSSAEMARRVQAHPALPWRVLESAEGALCGYAYASPWKARAAYRYSVECSVYVDPAQVRRGYARRLYQCLFEDLREAGMRTVIAGIAQPNAASVALHEAFGFRKVAHFERVGFKFGRWVDVAYWQLDLHD
ncbi:phosphinothricin acetyltransferase [Oleiagrimonas soli]|uniref:Phosphinothricin acetyltransferase n=1 Tax=Oleiagrimonas soli TaxID=1543381 RepID=A0A099CTH5_9GAMM|nr:phosphinothricin acetyltransferase [Oleiagrimonas soli]